LLDEIIEEEIPTSPFNFEKEIIADQAQRHQQYLQEHNLPVAGPLQTEFMAQSNARRPENARILWRIARSSKLFGWTE
jgi:hypothetical protein